MTVPKDMIVPILTEMRAAIESRFDGVDKRLEAIEGWQKSYNNALTADTMMSKFVTGDFEERIGALEKKVDKLIKGN